MKTRQSFVMQLHEGQMEEYRKRHDELWPELIEVLREHGVSNYSIHWHPNTHQLFAYAEIEDPNQWQSIADTEVCQRWWAYMKDIMPTNPDNSPKSVELQEVFHLA